MFQNCNENLYNYLSKTASKYTKYLANDCTYMYATLYKKNIEPKLLKINVCEILKDKNFCKFDHIDCYG